MKKKNVPSCFFIRHTLFLVLFIYFIVYVVLLLVRVFSSSIIRLRCRYRHLITVIRLSRKLTIDPPLEQ